MKNLLKVFSLLLIFGLLIPSSTLGAEQSNGEAKSSELEAESFEPEANYPELADNDGKPFVHLYDTNAELVKEFTAEEIKEMTEDENLDILREESDPLDEPFARMYDANGHRIDASAKEITLASSLNWYHFGATSFTNNIWIKCGGSFNKPLAVGLYPNGIVGKLHVGVFKGGTFVGSVALGNFSTDINVPISSYTRSGGNYSIQLKNGAGSPSVIRLKGGYVVY